MDISYCYCYPNCNDREAGIGCAHSPGTTPQLDSNRTEILRLLITCFSETMYLSPDGTSNVTWHVWWMVFLCASSI